MKPIVALLHCHYSGAVSNKTLIKFIRSNNFNIQLKNKELSFINHIILKNKNNEDKENNEIILKKVEKIIDNNIGDFNILKNLWHGIIKNKSFCNYYHQLLINDMKKQNIKHIELRITLGNIFEHSEKEQIFKNKIEHVRYLNYLEELEELYNLIPLYKKNDVSFSLICQTSKSNNNKKAFIYFKNIINIIKKNRKFKKLIKGFDFVGDEDKFHTLPYFKNEILKIKYMLKKNKLNIPFIFHCGEGNNIQKSLINMRFAIKHGGKRIAHGINSIYDNDIIKDLIEKDILLTICPTSNLFIKENMDLNIYYKLYQKGVKMCINTDDPNKFDDNTMQDEYKILLNNNFKKEDILKMNQNSFTYKL